MNSVEALQTQDAQSLIETPAVAVLPRIEAPPRRRGMYSLDAGAHTTALVGVGQVGTRYATELALQFQAELAVAHEAVAAELPADWASTQGLLSLQSQAQDHHQFRLRPDLGRRLSADSLHLLRASARQDIDVQPILADGLSAVACMGAGMKLLQALTAACEARGWSVGTPMCARYARVWLEDEIGDVMRAKVAIILLADRPGLGTGDGLSAYLVYEPRLGKTDGDRNMMSNIHERGIHPDQAALRLSLLVGAMLEQKTSGVSLDLSGLVAELGEAAGTGYRKPAPRRWLVSAGR